MRTKTLLLTAALSAAGLATSMAQSVFSVNAVGYVNIEIPENFSMIANPLDTTANTIPELFGSLPNGSTVFKQNAAGAFDSNSFVFGNWTLPNMTLDPGEGVFVRIPPGSGAVTITFVGEVRQGDLSHSIPPGFSVQSSEVPQAGPVDSLLGFPSADANGITVFKFDSVAQTYKTDAYLFGAWGGDSGGATPEIAVGEAFFVKNPLATALTWARSFSVNTSN